MRDDEQDLALLIEAARAAGELARSYFGGPVRTWTKDKGSPVSDADIAVDRMLAATLQRARPDYGWLSEETIDSPDRLSRRRVFVVDPIDGTRAFLAGSEEWTVSLAVVEGTRPVAGALYWPMRDTMFSARAGGGAFRNGAPIQVAAVTRLAAGRLTAPRGLATRIAGFDDVAPETTPKTASLALRIVLVADGTFDGALAAGNARDWDLAAADLILEEAGGRLTGLDGAPLSYNRPLPLHATLVGAGPVLSGRLIRALSDGAEPEKAPL